MKIKYTVEYHEHSKKWVVWKTIEKERSVGFKVVFRGTKEECIKKQKELQKGDNND